MGPADRLRQASELAGFETVAELARAVDIEPGTARQQIGRDSIPKDAADKYVRRLTRSGVAVTLEWLLHGRGRGPVRIDGAAPAAPAERRIVARRQADSVRLDELDIQGGAGASMNLEAMGDDADSVIGQWTMPRAAYAQMFSAPAERVRLIMVVGDSMVPTLHPGQRVMVDTGDRTPSPPGLFVVWDGLGLVIKRLEPVPGSNPQAVRIMSDNSRYTTYERTLDEAFINGRVVGLWART